MATGPDKLCDRCTRRAGQSTRLSSAAVRARVSWRFSFWPMRLDKSRQRQPHRSLCFSGPLCWARWPRAAILISSARCRPCGKSAGHSRSRRRSRLRRPSPSRHSTTLGSGTLLKLPTSARRRLCPANPFPCEPHRDLERRSLMRPLRLSRGRGAIATADCGRGGSLADRAAQRGRTRAGLHERAAMLARRTTRQHFARRLRCFGIVYFDGFIEKAQAAANRASPPK